jgi:hypothetical protein
MGEFVNIIDNMVATCMAVGFIFVAVMLGLAILIADIGQASAPDDPTDPEPTAEDCPSQKEEEV